MPELTHPAAVSLNGLEFIRLAAAGYDQRHVLIDRSGVNRLPANLSENIGLV